MLPHILMRVLTEIKKAAIFFRAIKLSQYFIKNRCYYYPILF